MPFYGQYAATDIVSRLVALPRRDWTPRVDELPRVVRIPGGRGACVLPPSVPAAELLRDERCRNPTTTTRASPGATRGPCSARIHVARVTAMDLSLIHI